MPKITITPPDDPQTLEEWQTAVHAADALLKLDAAGLHGLVTGGPDVDAERCCREVIHRAGKEHGIEPADDAVEWFVAQTMGEGG